MCIRDSLQTVFRSFEYILECSVSVFIEASAAGFTALAGILSIHYNGLLAAAAVTVVTVSYTHLDVYKRQLRNRVQISNLFQDPLLNLIYHFCTPPW